PRVGEYHRSEKRTAGRRQRHHLGHVAVRQHESRSHQVVCSPHSTPHPRIAMATESTSSSPAGFSANAGSSNQALIRLSGIKKVFYTDEVETHALQDIHVEVQPGEYVAMEGPSGCGKTTLLSILGLLDTPTDGEYTLAGEPVAQLTPSQRARIRNRQIGFIFQAFNLIGDLTVYENVELPLTYRGMSASERKQRVQDALERVGMSHRMK